MMAAPEGISRSVEISKPETVPIKANAEDNRISFLKSFVYKFAVACGMVSSDRIRIIPTTLMFKTTVSAIKVMVR